MPRWIFPLVGAVPCVLAACTNSEPEGSEATGETAAATMAAEWEVDFFDDFDRFDPKNWQDQLLWVNDEDQCYVRDGLHATRAVSDGTLKLRVVDLGEPIECDNFNKVSDQHPPTQYVAGRITSKNRQEFVKGRWTARLRVPDSGQAGMFPAWWLLGARNNEPPIEEDDEDVCWPMTGSGEIDIFEHHSDGGPDHYAARAIKSLGYCGGGDWQQLMHVQEAALADYHEACVRLIRADFCGDGVSWTEDGTLINVYDDLGVQLDEAEWGVEAAWSRDGRSSWVGSLFWRSCSSGVA
jgi:beta-glucanase (GH16 family)